jgi:hypothetical protein
MPRPAPLLGTCAIALAILFNVPFSILGAIFDYPDILRRPAGEVLDRFATGGAALILTWHGFALTAFALIPLTIALALRPRRMTTAPALAIAAAITGALAGLTQAIGLWRWVFVIPGLARAHTAPDATPEAQRAAERAFDILNAYGGVAIGEQLGQMLTALFAAMLSRLQWTEGMRLTALIAATTAAALVFGTTEGLARVLGHDGHFFAIGTIIGFMALTLWLIATGIGLIRRPTV